MIYLTAISQVRLILVIFIAIYVIIDTTVSILIKAIPLKDTIADFQVFKPLLSSVNEWT